MNKNMSLAPLLAALITLVPGTAISQDLDNNSLLDSMNDDEAELSQLLAILEEETSIATKFKANADFVPGIVTVLRGDDLAARGAATVFDALAFVPGIEVSHDSVGTLVSLVRGVGGTFASGNIKVLIDNAPINAALSALANPALKMPIELIDRIEVIRGPGSSLYGEYAFAGVVNIITRRDKGKLYLRMGADGERSLGGVFSGKDPASALKYTLALAGWQRDDSNIQANDDVLHHIAVPQPGVSNAPGPINDEEDYRSATLNLDYKKTSLNIQFLDDGHGDYFGTINFLPYASDDIAYENTHQNIRLTHEFELSDDLIANLNLGWQHYENSYDFMLLPAGYVGYVATGMPAFPFFPAVTYTNGYLGSGFYREHQLQGGVDFTWQGWAQHNVLLGLSHTDIKVDDAWQDSNVHPLTFAPLPSTQRFTGAANWTDENKKRHIRSVVIQDVYEHNEQISFTLGARYDDYDDVGSSTSPRIAGVYRFSSEHIFKAQYAQAFRPPTFNELWNSTAATIQPETIDTYELGYIHRKLDTVDRITLYNSKLKKLIISDGLIGFTNLDEVELTGIEIESERRLNDWLKLNANLSRNSAKDSLTGADVEGAAKLLANAGLLAELKPGLTLAADYRYVGERKREAVDPRQPLESYQTVDVTVSASWNGIKGLSMRVGVKNIFDEEIRYPGPLVLDSTVNQKVVGHTLDYLQPGREGWLQLSYEY